MKKRIIFILIVFLLLTGCGSNTVNQKTEEVNENKRKSFDCSLIHESSNIGSHTFVSNGKLYEYNLDSIYSNNKNCIEAELPSILYSNTNESHSVNTIIWSAGKWKNGNMNFIMDSDYTLFEYSRGNSTYISPMSYYKSDEPNSIFTDLGDVYYKEETLYLYNGEEITKSDDFKFISSINGNLIKTNNKYYILVEEITNKSECEKYADISCKTKTATKEIKYMSDNYNLISNGVGLIGNSPNGLNQIIVFYLDNTYEIIEV